MGKHLWRKHSHVRVEKEDPGCLWALFRILHHHRWYNVKRMLPYKKNKLHERTAKIKGNSNQHHEFIVPEELEEDVATISSASGSMKIPLLGARIWLCKARFLHQRESLRKPSVSQWLVLSFSSYSDTQGKTSKATPLQERRMIDRFRLHVKGGDGGNGSSSLRRSRNDRNGKPDGGNGGRGGDVILQCTSAVWDFRGLQHHINGSRGGHGTSKNKIGSRGEDKIVQVPVGTVIHLVEGEIPSTVEQPSSGYTDPWDIPAAVISDPCTSDQLLTSGLHVRIDEMDEDIAFDSSSCTNDYAVESADIKPYSRTSPIQFHSLPCVSRSKSTYCDSDNHNENDWKSMEDDDYNCEDDFCVSEGEWKDDLEEIQYDVAELTEEGQQIIVARGGEGGCGSVSSGKHSKRSSRDMNQHFDRNDHLEGLSDESLPSIRIGLPGSQAVLILELKSIADVGLVGMPNAGKSTLLGAISRAKPAVGHYAFTTLRPNIGKLNYDDLSVTVADIPGLIKGAHENRGLGHAFLRHIERTKILAFVVDLSAALDGRKGIPPWEQLKDLVLELEHYREGLSNRPSIVVASKIDEVGAEDVFEELKRRVHGVPIYPVCAILEEGIPDLKAGLRLICNNGYSASLRLNNILID